MFEVKIRVKDAVVKSQKAIWWLNVIIPYMFHQLKTGDSQKVKSD
jgi:hypothetical protein